MKFISQLGKYVVFPFLFPVFFVLHLARVYWPVVPAVACIQVVGLYLLISAVVFIALRKGAKHGAGAGLATLLIVALFVYWSEVINAIYTWLHLENFNHLPIIVVLWLILTTLLGWILNRQVQKKRQRITFFINLLFLIYIAVEVGLISYSLITDRNNTPLITLSNEDIDAKIKPANGPNIYFLLFDEYSSSSSIMEEWGYDNSLIDTSLKQRGFQINTNSRANYPQTFYAMASMLNMDYLTAEYERKKIDAVDDFRCYDWINKARAVSLFKRAGYRFYNLSIFSIDGQHSPDLRDFVVNSDEVLSHMNLYQVLDHVYIPYLKNRQSIRKDTTFRNPYLFNYDLYNNKRVNEVINVSVQKVPQRKFVYGHFLMPHAPFFYDSTGGYLPNSVIATTKSKPSPMLYWFNVKHTNIKMLQMVDGILKNEQGNAIIWIAGDHGFRGQQDTKNAQELYRNFNAVYFPDGGYNTLPDTISNVNTFRVLLNKVLQTDYPLLPNRMEKLGRPLQ